MSLPIGLELADRPLAAALPRGSWRMCSWLPERSGPLRWPRRAWQLWRGRRPGPADAVACEPRSGRTQAVPLADAKQHLEQNAQLRPVLRVDHDQVIPTHVSRGDFLIGHRFGVTGAARIAWAPFGQVRKRTRLPLTVRSSSSHAPERRGP